jgi:F-type H+-transporting ATPase subunit gamma
MTRRRDIQKHRYSLAEIREIMNSMKSLAYMETRKLSRFLKAQQAVVTSIEDVASDFLAFYPETLPDSASAHSLFLLIGSERGFCGNFSHQIAGKLEDILLKQREEHPQVIAVGHKLHTLLQKEENGTTMLVGPGVVEDIPALLDSMLDVLLTLQQQHGVVSLHAIYHRSSDEIVSKTLLPPFDNLLPKQTDRQDQPLLNLEPEDFMIELADQYLFAVLHEILYTSLMAENQQRVMHLESAVGRLDEELSELDRQINILRQEEITEEIEVLLLSTASLDQKQDMTAEENHQTERCNRA